MPADVESELARLGTAWSESIAHVDVAEVLERTIATRSQPIDGVVDTPATDHPRVQVARRSRPVGRWLGVAACTALVMTGVAALAQRRDPSPEIGPNNPATTESSLPIDTVAPVPSVTVPVLPPATSGAMWPQSTLDDVRAAQALADAGDPAYTWQLDVKLAAGETWEAGTEIFARFIEEGLGWEEYVSGESMGGAGFEVFVFIRCAPGQTNPLYPDAFPEISGCAPTIDELTYETVSVSVTQPDRQGPSGIWVVDRWEMLQPKSDPGSLLDSLYPSFGRNQVAQVVPPADVEVTDLMQAFLRARVEGAGAEPYLLREPEGWPFEDREVPLLYATTSGESYERFAIERVLGPVWPNGWTEYKVLLFAGDETVVEQYFHVVRYEGQLRLFYGFHGYGSNEVPTTENGQTVAVAYSFLDGEVTFAAAPPWYGEFDDPTVISFGGGRQHFVIAAGPLPVEAGCESGPAPAGAEALARSIMADPAFETTANVPVRIAGIDGLQIDGVVTSQWDTNWSLCYPMWTTNASVFRVRLYVIDHHGQAPQILTLAVIAPEAEFESVLDQATPIIESLEVHTR